MQRITLLFLLLLAGCTNSPVNQQAFPESELLVDKPDVTLGAITTDLSANTYATWVEEVGDSSTLFYRKFTVGSGWGSPEIITGGKEWFVNWADYPGLVSAQGDLLYAYFLKKSGPGTYSYDAIIRRSRDSGLSWETDFVLNEDGKQTEHGFVSMAPSGTDMYVAWLDGRAMAEKEGAMSLRAALFGADGSRKGEWQLDDRVCDCCQTAMGMTSSGPIVVYRDRSQNEFRDIAIVRFEKYKWTQPVLIYRDAWQISACPVNGPRVDAAGNDLVISWFTGANDKPSVNVIFSSDGGRSFSRPFQVSGPETIGRTDVVLTSSGQAIVSWVEAGIFKAVRINREGNISNDWIIGEIGTSRASGFPQLARAGDGIVAVWKSAFDSKVHYTWIEGKTN